MQPALEECEIVHCELRGGDVLDEDRVAIHGHLRARRRVAQTAWSPPFPFMQTQYPYSNIFVTILFIQRKRIYCIVIFVFHGS